MLSGGVDTDAQTSGPMLPWSSGAAGTSVCPRVLVCAPVCACCGGGEKRIPVLAAFIHFLIPQIYFRCGGYSPRNTNVLRMLTSSRQGRL